ncbi:hypothetical protein [Polyangium fumosum]|uniref:Uncharacterized protein n=1 Tax=Polyangium fumosum TaxID=889272 RepID=A0A4U1IL15_9BACT|nr:hypothetical protein [Polyangium fumosum]TKC94579.1 hypothetical protein E8A74_48320 [Polyangium fumosum]
MVGVHIDSEQKENRVEADAGLPSNHCVLIVEPAPLNVDDAAPVWRVSVDVVLRDPALGNEVLTATLPAVLIGPIIHKRQVTAIARYPAPVARWVWRFESDAGRARARVWLHPGESTRGECGISVVPAMLLRRGVQV